MDGLERNDAIYEMYQHSKFTVILKRQPDRLYYIQKSPVNLKDLYDLFHHAMHTIFSRDLRYIIHDVTAIDPKPPTKADYAMAPIFQTLKVFCPHLRILRIVTPGQKGCIKAGSFKDPADGILRVSYFTKGLKEVDRYIRNREAKCRVNTK